MATISGALSEALDQNSGEAVIRDVKTIVANELTALDSELQVIATDHFNHSFAPDFVVTWRDRGRLNQRDVFLRPTMDGLVAEDVKYLAHSRPVLLGLRPIQLGNDARRHVQGNLDDERECLISEADVLDTFGEPSTSVLKGVAKRVLVRGGRGLLDVQAAAELDDRVSSGDSVTQSGATARVANLIDSVRTFFATEYSRRFERVMQLLWMSNGHPLSDFPGRQSLTTELTEAEVRALLPHLLTNSARTDGEFWRLVGELVDLRLLESLQDVGPSDNLNRLIGYNLDRFLVCQSMLTRRDATFFGPDWEVLDSTLTLTAESFRCHLVGDRRKLTNRAPSNWSTRWVDLQSRTQRYPIEEVAFRSPTATVDVASTTPRATAANAQMLDMANSLSNFGEVAKATVRTAGQGGRVVVDFLRGSCDSGDQSARLSTLALASADLIYQADSELLTQLHEFFDRYEGAGDAVVSPDI